MAKAPAQPQAETADQADERIARLSVEVAIDPPFEARLPNPTDHGAYLEFAHESTLRTLAVIHLRLAKGDPDGALELVTALRKHLDGLWDQRKEAAERLVRA